MKIKSLVLFLTLISTACILKAQSYNIIWDQELPIRGTSSESVIKRTGKLLNPGFTDKVMYFRYDLSKAISGHDGAFCFGANCFYLFEGVDDPKERPGQNLSGFGSLDLLTDIVPNGLKGTTSISFTLFDGNNEADSLPFSITWIVDDLSSVPSAFDAGITSGPLPASSVLTVNGDALSNVRGYNLYSASGNLVRTFITAPSAVQQFDISDVSAGRYFLLLTQQDGSVTQLPVVIAK
ncbi:MAG: T9SS type A sorting domain-containing protein [Ignavibacteria bacterium]|nr:T9SS type A sorting domain-containing protein [Ignavibacteria bacterium]